MEADGDATGGELIVMTDGQENINPYIRNVSSTVTSKSVIVHCILYTPYTEPADHELSKLAASTGGERHFQKGQNQSELLETFNTIFTCKNSAGSVTCSKAGKVGIQYTQQFKITVFDILIINQKTFHKIHFILSVDYK